MLFLHFKFQCCYVCCVFCCSHHEHLMRPVEGAEHTRTCSANKEANLHNCNKIRVAEKTKV